MTTVLRQSNLEDPARLVGGIAAGIGDQRHAVTAERVGQRVAARAELCRIQRLIVAVARGEIAAVRLRYEGSSMGGRAVSAEGEIERNIAGADARRRQRTRIGQKIVLDKRLCRNATSDRRAGIVEMNAAADRNRPGDGVAVAIGCTENRRELIGEINRVAIRLRRVRVSKRHVLGDADLAAVVDADRKGDFAIGDLADNRAIGKLRKRDRLTCRRRQAGVGIVDMKPQAARRARRIVGTHRNRRRDDVMLCVDCRHVWIAAAGDAGKQAFNCIGGAYVVVAAAALVDGDRARQGQIDLRHVVDDRDFQSAGQRHTVTVAVSCLDDGTEVDGRDRAIAGAQIVAGTRDIVELIVLLESEAALAGQRQ
ncbi:hypothetical protein GFPCMMHI_05005 [Ensifer adhaerens]|nr:hypothetical protein [Ensifer adhaerens]